MSYSVSIPDSLPADGYRKLTPFEMVQRMRAMTCVHKKEAGVCQGQVYATLFFDGTGNNKDWTEPKTSSNQQERNKHSNIARLFNAVLPDPADGFFPYYIPGVGTPFKEIGDTSAFRDSWFGQGLGYMGAHRINWGITRIFNAVHQYATEGNLLLSDSATKTIVNEISYNSAQHNGAIRISILRQQEQKLATVLKSAQRKITSINVAVFGFSRGAAEARAFANWLDELLACDASGHHTLAGVPFRFYFMGLFDTVASVGIPHIIPGLNGHMAWAEGTQVIPDLVQQCVHYIALHEQRASFPLEMVCKVKQVLYPGMHSDVSGGYLPTEQGKLGQLSQIPLNDMHYEAVKAGVPLITREEMNEPQYAALKKQFDIPPGLAELYHAYWRANGIGAEASGKDDVVTLLQRHTRQYLQWHQALPTRADLVHRDFYRRATQEEQTQLARAQDDLAEQASDIRRRMQRPDMAEMAVDVFRGGPSQIAWHHRPVSASARELYAVATTHAKVPGPVAQLFNDYVHDSRAGFWPLDALEPHNLTGGYLRYRTIYQNQREQMAATASGRHTLAAQSVAQAVSPGNTQGAVT